VLFRSPLAFPPAMNLSTSQRDMHSSAFGTPGMSTSTSGSNPNPWGHSTSSNAYGSLSDSLNQSLTQARPQYQAGYLMVRVFLLSSAAEKLTGCCSLRALQMYMRPPPLPRHRLIHVSLQNVPQSGQRFDDVPIIPTKAKMNHALVRSTTSDFGTDSMFEKSRYGSLRSFRSFCGNELPLFQGLSG